MLSKAYMERVLSLALFRWLLIFNDHSPFLFFSRIFVIKMNYSNIPSLKSIRCLRKSFSHFLRISKPTKVRLVKAMVFPVVMYGYESWTVKNAERRMIDAFELWCWRRLLRVPWTARRSNQSILKEISPVSLEGMMRKLKLQYFDHLM